MGPGYRYSRWDGTQTGFDLDAEGLLGELADDLLYHGDLHAALRRALQQGFADRNGRRVEGVRSLLERIRRRREEERQRGDLGGAFEQIAQELHDVVADERAALDRADEAAAASGDERAAELARAANTERRLALDLLPDDLAGKVRALQHHDWTSEAAHQRFEELLERLRSELLSSTFRQLADALESPDPEALARTKDLLAELNRMLEQRAAGIEPDFDGFMERFGDLFPENPQSLDELLEVLARRMAAMQAFLNSLSPEQRAQLSSLSQALLEDLDLRWQMDQLGAHLRAQFPQMGWEHAYATEGMDPLSLADAVDVADRLGRLDELENLLRQAANPGALAEVDLDAARDLLGDDAAASLEALAELARRLEEAGLVTNREGRYELTAAGVRRIGTQALADLYRKLERDSLGRHRISRAGLGHERAYETKPYAYGDPFNLEIERTIRNALARSGRGVPVRLSPEDFEVERTEQMVRCHTVLLLDLSLSMPMRDNFLAAKKVAMALHALITTAFPRDELGIVGFSEVARELRPQDLPEVSWDFVYGTNMQHALALARRMLGRRGMPNRQIVMITDGEPTAHLLPDGEVFFHYPPVRETVTATLREVVRCTREGIRINTFTLGATPELARFVERMTALNRGRAFFTEPDTLGDYVLVDFLEQRRAWRGRRPA